MGNAEDAAMGTEPESRTGTDAISAPEAEAPGTAGAGATAAGETATAAAAPKPETAQDRLRIIMGDAGLARLERASVLVLGCGGVGSNCIEALARGGIGQLVIVDKDIVAPSNINRQAIAFHSTVGKRKVDVMAAMVRDINPACLVTAFHEFVLAETLPDLYARATAAAGGHLDYVVDAIDTISTKLAVAELAQREGFPLISAMGGAKKLHPECLRITDVHKTVNCPLARIMRKECRKRGVRHLRVIYSCEEPQRIAAAPGAARSERTDLGTASFMPPIMGQMAAGEVLRAISGVGTHDDTTAALAMHEAAQRGKLGGRKGGQS